MKEKEPLSNKIYSIAIGSMIASVVMLFFITGSVPFNLSAAWSEQGLGSSLVLLQSNASVDVGATVAGNTGMQGKVSVHTVQDKLRRDGMLYYQIDNGDVLVQAGRYTHTAMLTVPFIGSWVRALIHPIGLMALVGAPLVMFVLNMAIIFGQRIAPTVSLLESQTQYVRIKNTKQTGRSRTTSGSEPTTVLKPFKQGYSM